MVSDLTANAQRHKGGFYLNTKGTKEFTKDTKV